MNVSLGATLGLLAVSVLILLLTAGDLVNCGDHGNLTENRKTLWECRSVVEGFLGYQPAWADSLSRAITVVIGPLLTIVAVVLTVVRMSNHRFRPDSTASTVWPVVILAVLVVTGVGVAAMVTLNLFQSGLSSF